MFILGYIKKYTVDDISTDYTNIINIHYDSYAQEIDTKCLHIFCSYILYVIYMCTYINCNDIYHYKIYCTLKKGFMDNRMFVNALNFLKVTNNCISYW